MKIKSSALFLAIAGAAWIIYSALAILAAIANHRGVDIFASILSLFVAVTVFLFAYAVYKNKRTTHALNAVKTLEAAVKIKMSSMLMAIFSIGWLISRIYYIYLFVSVMQYADTFAIMPLLGFVLVLVPLALLLLALAVYKKMKITIIGLRTKLSAAPVSASATDMSVSNWLVTFLIAAIPLVGLVFLIIWAMDENNSNPIRKNWARANLIWSAIILVLAIIAAFGYYQMYSSRLY